MLTLGRLKKRHTIKIPKNITVIHCDKKNMLTLVGPQQTRSLKLKTKILLIPNLDSIFVTRIPVSNISVLGSKNVKKLQGTTVARIKQILIEITYTLYHKLNLVGVGYRVFAHDDLSNQIFFKLGYSHLVYFKVPIGLNSFCQKFTKLFLFGNCSFDLLTTTASQIRRCKLPEPYKGKGVLHDQEKILLKKGKKI